MTTRHTDICRPFLPTKNLAQSRSFYEALGFEKLLDGDVVIFAVGATSFILQARYDEEWAANAMMQLMIDDLDAWWRHIESLNLPAAFGIAKPKPPQMQPWGLRVAFLADPCGVLWHVAERRPNHRAD